MRRTKAYILVAMALALCLSLTACPSGDGDSDKPTAGTWWIRDYPNPVADPLLAEEITLTITIRFTGAPTVQCGVQESLACAWSDGSIDITASRDAEGRVVVSQALLGHEVLHTLNYIDPGRFPDPDEF